MGYHIHKNTKDQIILHGDADDCGVYVQVIVDDVKSLKGVHITKSFHQNGKVAKNLELEKEEMALSYDVLPLIFSFLVSSLTEASSEERE